jgi:hypothetical protein
MLLMVELILSQQKERDEDPNYAVLDSWKLSLEQFSMKYHRFEYMRFSDLEDYGSD